MSEQHPAVTHLLAAHAEAETVLLRVAAERGILAEHAPDAESFCRVCMDPTGIGGRWDCSPWPCRTVLGLAKAWGWEEAT